MGKWWIVWFTFRIAVSVFMGWRYILAMAA